MHETPLSVIADAPASGRLDREVRRVLNRARKPGKLAELPIIVLLGRTYGLTDPVAIVRRLVDDAFGSTSERQERLRDMIVRCDIEGSATQKAIAQEFHVSYRHFHRIRGEAIAVLCAYLSRTLDLGAPASLPIAQVEALAEVLAEQEPGRAEQIFQLLGPQTPARVQLTRLHARLDAGEELDEHSLGPVTAISAATALAIIAQSKELSGKPALAREYLARLHGLLDTAKQPLDEIARLELTWLSFLRAKYSANAIGLDSIAKALRRFATTHTRWLRRAAIAQATAEMHNGRIAQADAALDGLEQLGYQRRDSEGMGSAMLLRAQLAYLSGDFENARSLSLAAAVVLHRRRLAMECATTLLRAELLLNQTDHAEPAREFAASDQTFGRLSYRAMQARYHLMKHGDHDEARRQSEAILTSAIESGYAGIAAQSAATIGAAYDLAGLSDQARSSYLQALELYAPTWSLPVGYDLFVFPGMARDTLDALVTSDALVTLLHDRLFVTVPQITSDDAEQRECVRSWIAGVLSALAEGSTTDALVESIERLGKSNSSLGHYLPRSGDDIERLLLVVLLPLFAPSDRPRVSRTIGAIVETSRLTIKPGQAREFLIV